MSRPCGQRLIGFHCAHFPGQRVNHSQLLKYPDFGFLALSRRQVPRQLQSVPQNGRGLLGCKTLCGRFRSEPQILNCASPISGLFEVTCQPGCGLAQRFPVRLTPLSHSPVKLRSAYRNDSLITHLSVHRMHKLEASRNCPVRELLRVGRAQNAMPPRKPFTLQYQSGSDCDSAGQAAEWKLLAACVRTELVERPCGRSQRGTGILERELLVSGHIQ